MLVTEPSSACVHFEPFDGMKEGEEVVYKAALQPDFWRLLQTRSLRVNMCSISFGPRLPAYFTYSSISSSVLLFFRANRGVVDSCRQFYQRWPVGSPVSILELVLGFFRSYVLLSGRASSVQKIKSLIHYPFGLRVLTNSNVGGGSLQRSINKVTHLHIRPVCSVQVWTSNKLEIWVNLHLKLRSFKDSLITLTTEHFISYFQEVTQK